MEKINKIIAKYSKPTFSFAVRAEMAELIEESRKEICEKVVNEIINETIRLATRIAKSTGKEHVTEGHIKLATRISMKKWKKNKERKRGEYKSG